MKNLLITLFLIATVAFGAVAIAQRTRIKSQTLQVMQLQARVTELENQLKEKSAATNAASLAEEKASAEQKAKILQKSLTETSATAVEKSEQVQQLQQKLDDAKTNSVGNLIGTMLKDPKMKEMIKEQQKMYIGPMVDKTYGAFAKQANLSPDQAAALKDLLGKKLLVAADAGTSMMDSSLDASQRAEMVKQIKSDTEAYDAQIKQFLGDDVYQSFQSYEKTVPDRMVVDQFGTQLNAASTPLSDTQQQQLIQAMSEERNNFKWTVDFNQQNQASADLASMFINDNINQFAQEKERFDSQFLPRAKGILNPDQYEAFVQFQKGQRDMQIAGMKIAAQMFGGSK